MSTIKEKNEHRGVWPKDLEKRTNIRLCVMAKAVLRERFPKYGFIKWLIRKIKLKNQGIDFVTSRWSPKFATTLNIIIGIIQKV